MKKKFLIMDSRYYSDRDNSMCCEVCDTREEAERNKGLYGNGCVVIESQERSQNAKV